MKYRYKLYGDIVTDEKENKSVALEEAQRKIEEKAMTIGANIDSLNLLEDLINPEGKNGKS